MSTAQPSAPRMQSNSERMAGCAVTGNTKRSNRPIRNGTLNSTDVLTSTAQPSAPRMQSNPERMAGCAVTGNTKRSEGPPMKPGHQHSSVSKFGGLAFLGPGFASRNPADPMQVYKFFGFTYCKTDRSKAAKKLRLDQRFSAGPVKAVWAYDGKYYNAMPRRVPNRMKTIVVGSSERSGSARRNTDGVHGI